MANEIFPGVLVFFSMETEFIALFTTAKSGFPSRLISLIATSFGFVPVAKSTFDAKEIDPVLLVFSRTETVLELLLVI